MKKILAYSALSLAVLAGCQSTSTNQNQATTLLSDTLVVSPNDTRQYATLKLDNQIEVMLVSDPKAQKSAAALSVGVGLLNDPMTQQGMAHYLEHMLFLGTERYPSQKGYTDFMTQNGGAHNAYTWLDITNYMFKVNNNAYDEALDRFSDFFKAPKLYPEYIEKEKSAVNAEWSMRREMDFFGQFKLARQMMGQHPANRFLIGNLETLSDKEGSKLHTETVNFYNQYYSSNIMKVAMLSNRPISEMKALAKQYFGEIKNKNIADPAVTNTLDYAKVGKQRVYYKPNKDVKQLQLDFTIKNNSTEFALKPNRFVAYLLSNEMPGSPAQLLRDKGWVSQLSASASPDAYGNYGNLTVDVNLTDAGMKNREAIVATIMQYIELIKRQGVDEKYFNEIRTSLNNQFQFLEKGDEFGYVSNLADSMQKYPLNHAINAPYYYGKFDKAAINNVLAQLNANTLRVWYVSQQEETDKKLHFYDGQYRIEPISQAEIASWSKPSQFALALPSVNRLLPEQFAIKTKDYAKQAKPTLTYDKNGIKVWQQPSQRFADQPKGLLEVYINTPQAMENAANQVLYSVWADLYNLAQSTLATEASVAGMSVYLQPSNGMVLSINGFTDKQNLLLSEALKGLKVTPNVQTFNQAVDRYVRALQNKQKAFPYSQAFSEFGKLTRSGNFDDQTLISAAKSVNPAQLQTLIEQTLNQHQIRVFSFGNYDKQAIESLVNNIEQVLPENTTQTAYSKSQAWQPKAGEVYSLQKDIDVADVAVVDVYYSPVAGYAPKAAAAVLQKHFSTFVFDKLRTEEQLAYAVGAFASPNENYAGMGLFIQTPVNDAKTMQARFDRVIQQYKPVLMKMDDNTFAQLKQATLVALKEPAKNLQEEVSDFLGDWYKEKFDFDSREQLIAAVEKTTVADLQAFYQQTLLNPQAPRLNVQLRGKKFADKPFANIKGAKQISSLQNYYQQLNWQ